MFQKKVNYLLYNYLLKKYLNNVPYIYNYKPYEKYIYIN